ncbi:MAG: recombination-associated protein RdgC [Planctomycetota bacterium]
MSFRAFNVGGKKAVPTTERILEKLEQFAFSGIETVEEGIQTGWVGPNHLFDGDFSPIKVFRGRYAIFALRVDTRRVPGPVLAAHTAVAITETLEAEGLEKLGAKRKRELKLQVKRELLAETPPAQKAYGVFWNIKAKKLYLQGTSKAVVEAFRSLFERSFELSLEPQSPGLCAAAWAKQNDRVQALREARPVSLALSSATNKAAAEPALAAV